MPIISEEQNYDGAIEKIARLGLTKLIAEVREIVTGFTLLVEERKDANGGAAVRKAIDARFTDAGGWRKKASGGVDWTKCHAVNGTRVCLGVEVQFSGRSDLVAVDIMHLRQDLASGAIDVGVLVVPSDQLSAFLTDRVANMSDAKKHVHAARTEDYPLLLWAVAHDGPGPALPKQHKRRN